MKKRILLLIITTIAFVLFPLLMESIAQQVANPKASYKGVANFYSQRFFPVGQVAPISNKKVEASAADDNETTDASSTLDNLPKVGDTKTIKDANGQDVEMVLKNITQNGNQVDMQWEPVSGEGDGIGEVINVDGPGFLPKDAETDQTTDTTNTNTTNTGTTDATVTDEATVPATYDADAGTITYSDFNGNDQTIDIADIGLDSDWMASLAELGGTLSVTEVNGEVTLIAGADDSGAKKWEFDPSSRLVAHYTGEAGSEKISMTTTDQVYNSNYLWASDGVADPGEGPDGHFVAQRFNYKESGALDTVDYFAWTGGNRGGLHPELHEQAFGVELTKARYMYRQDTVYQTGSDSGDVTAECTDDNTKVVTKYYNDVFPEDWDPVYTGTVSKDEYGNYWLDTGCKKFLLVCATDGFDADSDGQSGADEMNSVDWESLVGKEITVRGNEIASDSEAGIYADGEQAEMFEVVDIITPEEKEAWEADGTYEEKMANMEAVASRVDPIHEGLIGSGEGPGRLGVVNLFNGAIPTAGQLVEGQQLPRRMGSLAPIYLNNLSAEDLDAIRGFATDALRTALDAAETAAQDAANTRDEGTDTTQDAATTFEATYDAEAGSIAYTDADGAEQTIAIDDLGWSADDLENIDTVNVTVNDDQTTVTVTLEDGTTLTANLETANNAANNQNATEEAGDENTVDDLLNRQDQFRNGGWAAVN